MFYLCSCSILTLRVDTIIVVILQVGNWITEHAHGAESQNTNRNSLLVKTIACGIGRQSLVDLYTVYTIDTLRVSKFFLPGLVG